MVFWRIESTVGFEFIRIQVLSISPYGGCFSLNKGFISPYHFILNEVKDLAHLPVRFYADAQNGRLCPLGNGRWER